MNKKIIICLWILFLCTNILQAKIYNVKDFGAVGDGQHIDSEAINQAIVQAAREGGEQYMFLLENMPVILSDLPARFICIWNKVLQLWLLSLRPKRDMTKQNPIPITAIKTSDTVTGRIPLSGELTWKILQSVVQERLTEKD